MCMDNTESKLNLSSELAKERADFIKRGGNGKDWDHCHETGDIMLENLNKNVMKNSNSED